jgi:hypothetical protein
VFAITMPVLYALADLMALPLFTWHPAIGQLDWGWVAARRDEGPAMYWYGWLASSALGAVLLGLLAAGPARCLARRLSMHLAWLVPLALVPAMIASLGYYWKG